MAAAVDSNTYYSNEDVFKDLVNNLIEDKTRITINKINSLNEKLPNDALYLKEHFSL
jgi:hypothetical protein